MTTTELLLTFAATFIAATTQSFAGFGFGLTVVPLLALVAGPREAVIVSNVMGTLLPGILGWMMRAEADWRFCFRLLVAAMAGLPFGFILIWFAPEATIQILISVVVIAATVALSRGLSIGRPTRLLDLATGFVSGVLKSSTSMSGPPVVLYLQGQGTARATFRGTLQVYFAILGLVTVVGFVAGGDIDHGILALMAAGLPGMLAGMVAGNLLHGHVNDAWFRRVVLAVLLISAIMGIVNVLV